MQALVGETGNVCAGHPFRLNEYARKNPLCADDARDGFKWPFGGPWTASVNFHNKNNGKTNDIGVLQLAQCCKLH